MNDPWHPIDCSGHVEITLPVGDAVEFVKMEQPNAPCVLKPWDVGEGAYQAVAAIADGRVVSTAGLYGEMVAMLEELEWVDDDSDNLCPICRGSNPRWAKAAGHAADCRLANLLKRVRGEA